MVNQQAFSNRRRFFGQAAAIGLGSAGFGTRWTSHADDPPLAASGNVIKMPAPLGLPSRVFVDADGKGPVTAERSGDCFTAGSVEVTLRAAGTAVDVRCHCPKGALAGVILRWEERFETDTLFLGDHWERGYGDLQWRFLQPERVMPWYFAGHHPGSGRTFLAGVKTQPSAMCFWTVDAGGISLWMDFRNGGSPSVPGDREISAATVISAIAAPDESPMAAMTRFCRMLCARPRLPAGPICGNNNWYYTYGVGFDAKAVLRDAEFLADVSSGNATRPYCVVDAGWTAGPSVCPGGPWLRGDEKRFPDMPGLANEIKKLGVRPGIWMRPTALMSVPDPRLLRPGPFNQAEKPLDLTLPENLALIRDDVARVHSWGFELIKHDFSTFDAFGKWGFEMGAEMTDEGWHFKDRSLTNAEIILRLYRALRAGVGEGLLLGCNTIGHLGAGLFEVQRVGDDTSGKVWERTRRMGVNTLAFRMPQHGTFFVNDADCAAHTNKTPWELDRQFLDAVARSGTALFISVDPVSVEPAQKSVFRSAMQLALNGAKAGDCEPLDWLYTTAPRQWRFGNDQVTYNWEEPFGATPARV